MTGKSDDEEIIELGEPIAYVDTNEYGMPVGDSSHPGSTTALQSMMATMFAMGFLPDGRMPPEFIVEVEPAQEAFHHSNSHQHLMHQPPPMPPSSMKFIEVVNLYHN